MRLPNKVNDFNNSIISRFPVILSSLEHQDMRVAELYQRVRNKTDDVGDFIEALDCLYALGKIHYNAETRLLSYVGRD